MSARFAVLLLLAVGVVSPTGAQMSSFRSYDDAKRRLERMEYLAVMATPPLSCYIESGFDYVGQDIKNVPSATPQGCCGECYMTNGCGAFSWTNANGGTCWLKSGRGPIVVNPNVQSALLLYGDHAVCQPQQNVDYVGNDLERVSGTSAECCDRCHQRAGCRAYSWSNYLGGSCWLKSKGDQTVNTPGVVSAQAYPVGDTCAAKLEMDTDYVDNDIGNAPSSTAGGCCLICAMNIDCRAFSWNNANGGTCWLKGLKGTAISKPGVISAQVRENPAPCVVTDNTDYVDNDIDNSPSADPTRCCDICRGRSGCKAFSWSNYNGGTCWLKSAKGATVTKNGVKSGTI